MTIQLNVLKVKFKDVFKKSKGKLTKMSTQKYILKDFHLECFVITLRSINFQRIFVEIVITAKSVWVYSKKHERTHWTI